MLHRKIAKEIQEWYLNSSTRLLIDCARQIGKITIIRDFLVKSNKSFIELKLFENKLAQKLSIRQKMKKNFCFICHLYPTKELIENEIVIFIDEIQVADDAITSIKFLVRNTKFKLIFSGSLLGIKMQDIQLCLSVF